MVQDLIQSADFDAAQQVVWGRSAASYEGDFRGLTDQAIPALLDAAEIRAGMRVLDVASGPGTIAQAAASRGAEVIGVDFAPEMVAVASAAHPGLTFQEADAAALPFEDASFDAVVIGFGIHHMGRPLQSLGEARRVLRAGGRMAFTVWDAQEKLDAFQLVFAAIDLVVKPPPPELDQLPPLGASEPELLQRMAESTGFKDVQVRSLPIVWELPAADSVFDALSAVVDVASLPENASAMIRARVVESARVFQDRGVYRIPNPAILVSGQR